MNDRSRLDKLLAVLAGIITVVYICSIFAINLCGRTFVNFDMYSDAVLAKYMALERTLFPEGWHFGNQIYTVATPAVASLIYPLVKDSYSALSIASCFMTMLCVVSFVWCIKPFVKPRSIVVGLLVLMGGTNIAQSAQADWEGLQLFYTMASYYSCYVIGILLTLGVWCRYIVGISVRKPIVCGILLLNFALGVQSLREMLVLNLPLCATAVLLIVYTRIIGRSKRIVCKRHFVFAVFALLFNAVGVLLNKWLVWHGTVVQNEFFRGGGDVSIGQRFMVAMKSFVLYAGINIPTNAFDVFKIAVAAFSLLIVVAAIVCIIFAYINNSGTMIGNIIVFLSISLVAVFLAGVFVIQLRQIYYFCWYLLVAMCVVYHMESGWKLCERVPIDLARLMLIGLIVISTIGYVCSFVSDFIKLNPTQRLYQNAVEQLREDGIKYVYSDWRDQINMISTLSEDEIVYATLAFSNDPDDLWDNLGYLYMDSWFEEDAFNKAYVILTDDSKIHLERDFSTEYVDALMSNLELVYEFAGSNSTVYFYKGTEKLYYDMAY